ncbi:uncharacterized protein BP5553_08393 [Venustampulla echinocandica]|uniref:Structure-specific endonuclease subunit SLX4 n=1 Tax=Venustampulla echinocandica TaxID=2656787 RepID=A0A370TE33_9HELO|nr:uncharacterized protein BP5553_08393 [Venustampulla echinocandica]RDL32954.1 hypothetical protein BP5553_08393 [Venustampulla echinocandica]
MASADTLMLPSSPLKQFATYNMSSSPTFLSPNEIFKRNTAVMTTGGRSTPIPQRDVASFTSTAALLKKSSLDDLESSDYSGPNNHTSNYFNAPKLAKSKLKALSVSDEPITEIVTKAQRKTAPPKAEDDNDAPKVKKVRKPRAKKAEECEGGIGPVKKAPVRKPRLKKAEKETTEDRPGKEKPVRKARTKKSEGASQTKIPKGQVIKASVSTTLGKHDGTPKSKEAELVRVISPDPFSDSLDYGLAMAVSRRTGWTPPSNLAKANLIKQAPTPTEPGHVLPASVVPDGENKGFHDLFHSFRFAQSGAKPVGTKELDGEGTRKRKLIELVQTTVSSATAAATTPKPKAPKKKPRTITDQATSAYAEEHAESLPGAPAPLLQYLPCQINDNDTSDAFKIPRKPRSQLPPKRISKAKKGSAEAPILLSPESALKQVGHQDFVFGTSSQLARETSPTLLRDLHDAMQASNQIDYDPFTDWMDEPASPASLKPPGRTVSSAKRTLWSAGARDATGNLLDVEVIDIVDSPMAMKVDDKKTARPNSTRSLPGSEEIWHDIEDIIESLPENSEPREPPLKGAFAAETATIPIVSTDPPKSATSRLQSTKSAQTSKPNDAPLSATQSSTTSARHEDYQMPDFDSYTTIQLTKELASYRFKPVKRREQMITLLEKCWESKTRTALGSLGLNAAPLSPTKPVMTIPPPSSQVSPESPKRPRGKPKSNSAVTTAVSATQSKTKGKVGRPKATEKTKAPDLNSDVPLSRPRTPKKSKSTASRPIDEIYDSDPPTPSPPRRRPSQIGSQLPLKLSSTVDGDVAALTPESSQAPLFTHITRAIKISPRSKDPLKPSWQEKILLFDPIVVEDLSTWLNTGALEKVGWDGEVNPKEVKQWCASKSICCLWKENLRGATRSHM